MLLRLTLGLALPAVALAARVAPEGVQVIESVFGVPRLQVLATSNFSEAGDFLRQWEDERELGLFVLTVPDSRGFYPKRVGLIGISHDTQASI